jgi:type II secretory pathway pseudopilin PulG
MKINDSVLGTDIAGFSLIEILASLTVLVLAAVGITAAWKLADTKALVARLDDRATRILREYYELQTFAPDYLFIEAYSSNGDPNITGLPLKQGTSRQGFLYHPRLAPAENGPLTETFADRFPYTVSLSSDGTTLTVSYDLPAPFGGGAPGIKQIGLSPRSAAQ